jgi:putative lipoic acid-binding regulatory protein
MRKGELLASEYLQKESNQGKLHELRGTLCDKHSDQIDRLDDKAKKKSLLNSSKTHGPMKDLGAYSQQLEDSTKNNIEGANKNELLKEEFRSFYDIYQLRESQYDHEIGEQELLIEELIQRKKSTGCMVDKELNLLNSLKDKLLSARTKEASLKTKLQDMAAKFEMFTGLLNDSNKKFASIKIEMNSKTEFSKKITHEISEFKKKIVQTNLLVEPANMENVQRREVLNKILKQIEQLEALYERLQSQCP